MHLCVHKEIYGRNWLLRLWGPQSLMVCCLQAGEPEKKPLIVSPQDRRLESLAALWPKSQPAVKVLRTKHLLLSGS